MRDEEIVQAAVPRLIAWYRANRRPLPWRREPTPYHVWISEIMLQQTRIEAALGYYARFLEALPDVRSLAEVEEDRLLKLWEGLGYYSRARNLKKAALQIVERYGGELPRKAEALRALPGIGDYTAGAIASIAYGEPEPAVDGNVMRVVMRLLASSEDVMAQANRKHVTALLKAVYPAGADAALLTEGIMELGETVCIPNGEAACLLCPLSGLCRAFKAGTVQDYPVRSKPKERRLERRTVLLLRCGERYAVRKRGGKGLLAGLWEFPNEDGSLTEAEVRALIQSRSGSVLALAPCGEAKHVFTHVEWRMRGWRAALSEELPDLLWKTPEEIRRDCPIPTALRYYEKKL